MFFECTFSTEVWRSTIGRLAGTGVSTQWHILVHQLVTGLQDRILTFLLRYCFQAVVYALWHERSTRRVGENPQTAGRLIIFLDRMIRNRISSLRRRTGNNYEQAMEIWFGGR